MSLQKPPLLDLVVQARTLVQAGDSLSEAHIHVLWQSVERLVVEQARNVMRGKPGGFNFANHEDLASVGLAYFAEPPNMRVLKFKGQTEGELKAFVKLKLNGLYKDDLRKLYGRPSKKSEDDEHQNLEDAEENPADKANELLQLTDEQRDNKVKDSPFIPRVYVGLLDEEGKEFLPSQRRSATGYLLLKQQKNHLHDYLNLMPGSVVMVPYGPRSKLQGSRPVRLTNKHSALLRVWMSGEGDYQWKEIASQMGTAVGNVKRWWAEAVAAFMLDKSPRAKALRDLYRPNTAHTRRANNAIDEPEDPQEIT